MAQRLVAGLPEQSRPWFETRRFAPLLTMRGFASGLILRSPRSGRLERWGRIFMPALL
jgi:hypothetical protein